MRKCLYNGVELPALPDWDRTLYPNAVIFQSGTLWVTTDAVKCDSDGTDISGAHQIYSIVDDEYVLYNKGSSSGRVNNHPIWTYKDIFERHADENVVWLAASAPVPVGGVMPSHYYYNGVELPDINTVWTDKETYPYAAMYISCGIYHLLLTKEPGSIEYLDYYGYHGNVFRYRTSYAEYLSDFNDINENYYGADWLYRTSGAGTWSYDLPFWSNYSLYHAENGAIYREGIAPLPIFDTPEEPDTTIPEYAIIPAADYKEACDFIRSKSGKTDLIKSGQLKAEIEGIAGGADHSVEDAMLTGTLTAYSNDRVTTIAIAPYSTGSALSPSKETIKSVSFPNLETVPNELFAGFVVLESVNLPKAVEVGDGAFDSCESLKSISLPNAINVGHWAFAYCLALESVDLPKAEAIGESCFSNTPIETITLPSAKNVGIAAFGECQALRQVNLPNATEIGENVFNSCPTLTDVVLPQAVSIGQGAFNYCESLESIELPEVTELGEAVFYECNALEYVSLPKIAAIVNGQLQYAPALKTVNIPMATELGESAFSEMTALENVIMPNMTTIGANAFDGCTGLTVFTVPDSVTSIGKAAFKGCNNLTSITIPFVESTFAFIFGGSVPSTLKTVVVTGGSTVVERAFSDCTSLTSIVIPNSVTSIGDSAFSDCTGLTSITIPDSVTNISGAAFRNCTGLTSITIPNGVTSISGYAFSGCTSLTNITLPDSVTRIGSFAFSDCTSLTSIVIPNSITSIDSYAFSGCGITDVYYTGTQTQWNLIDIIPNGNDAITNATIHYNYTGGDINA